MKDSNPNRLWARQLQHAVRQGGGASVAAEAEWFRLGSANAMLRRVPRKIADSRALLQSVNLTVNAIGDQAESYESFAAMIVAEEKKTIADTKLLPDHRSALLAGFATARYSASFHANGAGTALVGEASALKFTWKGVWEKIKPVLGADLLGAAGGCLLGIATTANPAGCGAGAITGGALASYKALPGI